MHPKIGVEVDVVVAVECTLVAGRSSLFHSTCHGLESMCYAGCSSAATLTDSRVQLAWRLSHLVCAKPDHSWLAEW